MKFWLIPEDFKMLVFHCTNYLAGTIGIQNILFFNSHEILHNRQIERKLATVTGFAWAAKPAPA